MNTEDIIYANDTGVTTDLIYGVFTDGKDYNIILVR